MLGRLLLLWLLGTALAGCAGGSYAPVSDRDVTAEARPKIYTATTPSKSSQHVYRVQKGDTLYSIAFRFGKDYKQLARNNGINKNYSIYPGQLINLTGKSKKVAKPPVKKSEKPARTQKAQAKQTKTTTNAEKLTKIIWIWPVKGKVIQAFNDKGRLNKGINIAAAKGRTVAASAAGEVVYAGSGLLGYGNLVIIKHNNKFLSAYAHNSRLFVKEKDRVKQGQKIAEVGDSGAARTMLHFEIRKDGKPVNPLRYLP